MKSRFSQLIIFSYTPYLRLISNGIATLTSSCVWTLAILPQTAADPIQSREITVDDTALSKDISSVPPVPWEGDPSEKPVWWEYSYGELFDYLNCAYILPGYATLYQPGAYVYKADDRTIDPAELQNLTAMWDEIRIKYKREVNLSPPGSSAKVITVPAEIGNAGPDKGNGLFVTEFVPMGSLVVNVDSDQIAIFKDGHSWRVFAATLPRYTGCNFIEWSWAQNVPPGNEDDIRDGLTIFVAWDESNLLNNADWNDSDEEPNVKCGTPPKGWLDDADSDEIWGPCRFHYYAIRDIDVGEEILMAYGEFEDFRTNWPMLGLPVLFGLPEPAVDSAVSDAIQPGPAPSDIELIPVDEL